MDWKDNVLTDRSLIRALLADVHRVAVLGIRSEAFPYRPAYYVPRGLAAAGLDIVPVPVYEPEVERILDRPVYRSLFEIPGDIDLVDVFRRPADLPGHLEDILAKRPRAVWFQSGIRNDEVAETLARDGILVVQDRCLLSDYRFGAS